MGWIEKVKSIIERLRKSGKSEKEIETIVQQASDKATVTQTVEHVGEAIRMMNEGAKQARDVMDAFLYAAKAMSVYNARKNTNNWRRMHGLPMRRKVNRRKRRERGKRADNHPKNADVS